MLRVAQNLPLLVAIVSHFAFTFWCFLLNALKLCDFFDLLLLTLALLSPHNRIVMGTL